VQGKAGGGGGGGAAAAGGGAAAAASAAAAVSRYVLTLSLLISLNHSWSEIFFQGPVVVTLNELVVVHPKL